MRPTPTERRAFDGTLHAHRAYTMHTEPFDHGGIPVLGVALRETEHLSVNKDRLERTGLVPGPWLSELKNAVRRCLPDDTEIEATSKDGTSRRVLVGRTAAEILFRTPGQTMAYLTDLGFTTENVEKAVRLASGVSVLVCEAAFLHADEALAADRGHLTARQAGELARTCGAGKLAPFHFSPRYAGRHRELLDEAAEAFGGPVIEMPRGPC
jgi:ribonuclease Z